MTRARITPQTRAVLSSVTLQPDQCVLTTIVTVVLAASLLVPPGFVTLTMGILWIVSSEFSDTRKYFKTQNCGYTLNTDT